MVNARKATVLMAAASMATVLLCAGSAQAVALDDTLTISPPANVTVPATMPCGQDYCAQVNFSFTASGGSPPYNFVCGANSGSLFTVGSHNVGCLAQDSRGNSTPIATFSITVTAYATDTTPPVFHDVPPISVTADSSGRAVLSYPLPTATDNVDGSVPVHCDPWHGGPDAFPLGTTTATCTATDSHGNTATTSFTITVTAASTPAPGGTTTPSATTSPTTTTTSPTTTTTPPATTTAPPATGPTGGTTTSAPTTAPPATTTVTQTATQPPAPASPPIADFTAASAHSNVVTFTDTSKAGSAPISTQTWQFGDGSSASGAHPTHAYRGPGSYTVTEITVDAHGLTSLAVHQLTIAANHAVSLGPRQTQAKKKPAVKHAPAKRPKSHRTKP
ncbi:MAG: endo,4-beta-xylanase [Gaiellaceae bacterium]|nr:endo,4-beta-xylanase [Gaiellaceae bacterium]